MRYKTNRTQYYEKFRILIRISTIVIRINLRTYSEVINSHFNRFKMQVITIGEVILIGLISIILYTFILTLIQSIKKK